MFVDRRESTNRDKTHQITGGMSTRTSSARVTDNESRLFAQKDGKYRLKVEDIRDTSRYSVCESRLALFATAFHATRIEVDFC